ncbi:MAG TPA: cyclic nucleotide-binding domain-containing protein [Planctomycetota bacterium]|nr:cyclic nucleotide-binding domain-containing protein [Planctomycetota bacterium]
MTDATKAAVDELLALPLFADVDKKLLEGVRKEASITAGTFEWAPGVARREGFVRFVALEDGQDIVRQGDLTTELVVVLSGRIEAVQARPGAPAYRHRTYGKGDWFGEVSAHSHHPALTTCRAIAPSRVATLEERLFTKLYAEDDEFKERIDAGYLDNLGLHLRASSLCRDLDEAAIATLQAGARLLSVDEDDVVAEAGQPADTVYLVRAGAIGCYGAGDRALAFYKGNATFGEHAVATPGGVWPATYKALMRTALVALPRAAFDRLGAPARSGLMRAANRLIGTAEVDAARGGTVADLGGRLLLDELHVMVEHESVKGGRALVIDRTKCVRCNMCVESCVAVHDDHVPRLSKVGTPVVTDEVLVTACYHCETPQCMLSCDYAAIRRDPQGRIRFEYDNCVGCTSCIDGCPYGVIRLVEPAPPPAPPPSFLASLPLLGRFFGGSGPAAKDPDLEATLVQVGGPAAARSAPAAPDKADKADKDEKQRSAGAGGKLTVVAGKTIKCDLCAGLPFEACVYNCPTTAILRREPQSLFDLRKGL